MGWGWVGVGERWDGEEDEDEFDGAEEGQVTGRKPMRKVELGQW